MSAKTIRNALGILQDEPDNDQAWTELYKALGFKAPEGKIDPGNLGADELGQLLQAARKAHEMRREYDAVANLLEIEAALASGEREAELVAELARLRDDVLLDDAGTVAAYKKLLELRPGDTFAEEVIERCEARNTKWRDLVEKYIAESKAAGDASFKSSLLVTAAEALYRYGLPQFEDPASTDAETGKKRRSKAADAARQEQRQTLLEDILGRLREALELDPKNRRAAMLVERVLGEAERWEDLAAALEKFASEAGAKDEKVAALNRLARLLKGKLGSPERAVAAYERVLDLSPGHPEASRALVDFFTERQMWDHLVSLYDGQLSGGGVRPGHELGVILQIAMVNWKMRANAEAAEPYFERLRKLEPAHPGMLGFFREWCRARGEQTRLVAILTDAQRTMSEGPERSALAAEIAQLAEEGANAQKAIEQWRNLLRSEPGNASARDALKRLYRQTGAFNHLADLLRTELERTAPDDAEARLPVLREIAQIYRESIKSESALVTVLTQIIALDADDANAVRELARVYEALGRFRDLLTTQMRLAELETDAGVRAEIFRSVARRWLDQFSNVQNAVEAFEKLRQVVPDDREAIEKLKELYGKRRAYRQLFDLHEVEARRETGASRRAIWMEMAKMAADRLDRGADATRLYKQILAEDPNDAAALDALEKQAERDKDFVTVAEALEKRAELTTDSNARLVVLQKLGSVYADRLADPAGALRVWRRVLELSPGHQKALRIVRESYLAMADYDGLTELYAQTNDWTGLVDVLSSTADRTDDTKLKIDLSFRAAALFEAKLGTPERAARSYERVLAVKPDDRRAASALVPLFEAEEKWTRLPALYEVLVGHAEDDVAKRGLYRKLAIVAGQKLGDKVAAFTYARKAFELSPAEHGAVRELEEWARASGEWAAFLETIEARASAQDATVEDRRELRMKLAEVSAIHTGRADDAILAYRELIAANPDDEDAIASLDRLLRSGLDRHEDLRWLFRLRANKVEGEARVAVLSEWALLEEEAFGSSQGATAIYREILSESPTHLAGLRALARLLLAAGDYEGGASALERQRDVEEGEQRVTREIELARLYLGQLKRPLQALAAAKRALDLLTNDPRAVAVVEELLPVAETRGSAAVILEQTYAAMNAFAKQGEVLGVLIAIANSKADRLALYERLADVKQRLGDWQGAFDVVVRATEDAPAELELWDRLSVLANRTHRTQQFVNAIAQALPATGESGLPEAVEIDLAERAATLYDEMLGEIDRAIPYLERILSRDATNERAFLRLKQILTTREKWRDLEALYERVITATEDLGRRAELLGEVALIAEEITGDPAKAIHFYERVLELEPTHDQAIFALDKLYGTEERWQKLADLLGRRIVLAGDDDTSQLKLRLGTLLFTRLGDPKAALNYLEEVVTDDPANRDARELVEKSLAHPDLRQRAAIILEGVYTEREEMRELVRVLEVRLEFVTDDVERRELLRRIAELRDERLSDDAGSFEAYGKLLPLSPGDVEARQRFLEVAERLQRVQDAAEVLVVTAKNAEAPQPRAEILGAVAKIFEDTDQIDRAEDVHRQVLDLAPEDPQVALPAVRALERIYIARGKNRELADVLRVQVRLEEAPQIRRDLLGRLGSLCEQVLSDDMAAIVAYKARLEDDPADEVALEALDRLYERTKDDRALVEILRAREQKASGADTRKTLMVRAAQTLAERLKDVPEAIVAYRAVLDDFGADRSVIAALAKLYEEAEQWPDLADILEAELGLVTEPSERIVPFFRLGEVRRKRLGEKLDALEAYRQTLTIEPTHEGARGALEELLDDDGVKSEAADILRPLYEASSVDAKLVRVLDIQIEKEEELTERLALIARAADVTEQALVDYARSFGYASRGLREAAEDPALPTWVERVERLVQKTGAFADLVQLYRVVLDSVTDEEQKLSLTLRTADLARTELKDAALAKQYYRAALDVRGDETRALLALEELYEESAEHEQLIEILKRRAEVAETDDDKRKILYKLAKVCDEAVSDRDRAIAVYEQILDLGLDAPALVALEKLYAGASRWNDLVAVYERELASDATTKERRAALHHSLGKVYQRDLADIDRAFEEYGEALQEQGSHEATIASLEELMAQKTHAGRAAEMLEEVYVARFDWRNVMVAVEARLEASQDPDERRTLLRRLAKLHEEQEESYSAALDVTARLLREDVADETTWAELERLARVANAESRLATIFASELEKTTGDEPATARLARRTGELFEAQNESDRALVFYRRAYQFSREDEQEAFEAIDRLLLAGNRHEERIALYRDALEYRNEPAERIKTLRVIGRLEEDEIKDDDAAIQTQRAILDIEEADAEALDSLARLYTRRERWRDLADLHRRRAEQSALPEEEASFRLQLGCVYEAQLADPSSAIDELGSVIELAPPQSSETGRAAVAVLESLLSHAELKARVIEMLTPIYEHMDNWRKLVDLAKHRFEIAKAPEEKVAVLRDRAKLLEYQGNDLDGAFECLKEAFMLDPDDGETREQLDRVAGVTERWEDLADAYEFGIGKSDGIGQRELLFALAKVHDDRRDDPRKALGAWDRLFKLDESDPRPLDEMDNLSTLLSDWTTLVRVLAKRAELTNDDEERASLWRRIGEARRDMLDDVQGAIDAYERALELESDSTFTLDNLISLYEGRSDAPRLVDLYRRRVELSSDDDIELKHRLLLDAAKCYEVGLNDRREAVVLLSQALATKPGDTEVMSRLSDLYQAERMWPELLESLRTQASTEGDSTRKASITKRIGKLLASELDDHDKALSAYAEVLEGGFDEEATLAVRQIGEAREELRRRACEILEPVLRNAERYAELVDALEMRLRSETEPGMRADTLREIAQVCEQRLSDLTRAQAALLRALAELPENGELHDEIERIAGLIGRLGWERYADALGERAASIFEAHVTASLFTRLGKVAETQLDDAARAGEAYARAAEQGGDNPDVLTALERIYARREDPRALADVLERRIGIETDSNALADLHHRLGSLQIGSIGDKAQGLATLRLALERVPEHEKSREAMEQLLSETALFDDAFETLEEVYRRTGRGADLGRLYARRIDRAEGVRGRTRARLELSRILETEANDPSGAQRAVEAAVVEDPNESEALSELERLAEKNAAWPSAADALARALENMDQTTRQSSTNMGSIAPVGSGLWARLGSWRRDHVGDTAGAEAAFTRAVEADPENIDLVRAVEALMSAPGRERDRIVIQRRLLRLEGDLDRKRDLAKDAVNVAETVIHDARLAEEVLRELLAENDGDLWAVEELMRLRRAAGDYEEVVRLLLRRAETESDPANAIELRHRAAEVSANELGDRARAATLFESILESEPGDTRAQSRLRTLYDELGKARELEKLLGMLVERATSAAERSALRLDIAKLRISKFEAPKDAVDTLRAILEEDPDHEEAARMLGDIFTSTQQYSDLADLQTQLATRARARGDSAIELAHMLALGEIYEEKVGDAGEALKAYEDVLERDATHRGALEAVARLAETRNAWEKASNALTSLLETATGDAAVALALRLAKARQELNDDAGVERALKRALDADPKNGQVRERLAQLLEKTKSWTDLASLLVGNAEILALAHPPYIPPQITTPMPIPAGRNSMPPMATVPPVPAEVQEQVRLLRRAAEIHLKERNSPEDAAQVLERIVALVPQDRDVLLLLVDAYAAAKRERDAAQVLERVIASFGTKRTKELSLYHHRLGKALASLGDKDVALSQFDMAFKIDPGSVEVLRDLGVLALETNDLDRAQKTFRALLLQRLDSTSGISKGEVFYYLGEISMKQGDKAKAVQMLERAVENEPSLERARAMLTELKS